MVLEATLQRIRVKRADPPSGGKTDESLQDNGMGAEGREPPTTQMNADGQSGSEGVDGITGWGMNPTAKVQLSAMALT